MALAPATVFVFGAGFTKGVLPNAPLLIDDYYGADLLKKFANFPNARAVLEMEMTHPDHAAGRINLERLMTRLAGGMPYDLGTGANNELAVLLADLKTSFRRRLDSATSSPCPHGGDLWLFAGHCILNGADCITFNYDDVLDQALWGFFPRHYQPNAWSPDWGYGFPCLTSEACVTDVSTKELLRSPMRLLKLHGSVNWRIPLGQQPPFTVAEVRHHEMWFDRYGQNKIPADFIERFLESTPFLVPPILTKTELVEQPILRLVWSLAREALQRAKKVIFIGYSLPITDVAAGFLFREGLRHLDQTRDIAVVDFAANTTDRKEKLQRLLPAYRNVFPEIRETQFDFSGTVNWLRNTLAHWLYNSKGQPIAFLAHGLIFSRFGRPIGHLRGYEKDRMDAWDDTYKGEIIDGNRFLYREGKYPDGRGPMWLPPAGLPGVPKIPKPIKPFHLPTGFRDILLPSRNGK